MLQFSAYLYDEDLDNYNVNLPFLVHSCGRVSFNGNKDLHINRLYGRRDFQLIYIHQGKGHFILDNRESILDEGCTVLYHPYEIQQYSFHHSENAQFYWLHFSGNDIPGLLREAGLDRQIIDTGMASYIPALFEGIIRELIMKQQGYLQITSLKGQELVWLLAREAQKQEHRNRNGYNMEMEEILETIHLKYNQDLTIEQLARAYGTSTGWFIKEFSRYTGNTPKKYINEVRLNHAKELLSSTNYNISKISTVCGFENPLYFSRYFQKNYHMAPTKYRNTLQGRA